VYPGVVLLAVLCLFFGAYAARMRTRAQAVSARLDAVVRRESDVLEAVRVLTAASRESTQAVLTALDRTLRVLDTSLDAVLIFAPEGEELACVFAAGARTEHFAGMRVRRDHALSLPARAAMCGHRVELAGDAKPIIPTDRAAVAVPMIGGDGLAAVVYAATTQDRVAGTDLIVRAVAQAASPYALAAEREADRRSATYDGLTGLYTPRAFRAKLQEELAVARLSRHASLALWFIDTDHFKRVNDSFGHAAGDVVLQRMANLLREHTVPDVDLPARNGGDEFCAIIRNVHKVSAIERAARFCRAVRECGFGVDVPITASIGVAAYPYDAAGPSELLEVADAAMYHSKRSGRDRVSFSVDGTSFAVFS
jgi:diguanylate cyclase (GGDEF)-like protein